MLFTKRTPCTRNELLPLLFKNQSNTVMKKIYIVVAGMVVAAIVLLINVAGDTSAYSTFEDAARSGGKVKVAGQLAKDQEMHYNPEKDPNHFTFFLTDSNGEQRKVVLLREKPQDFEMSEQLVLTGRMKNGEFVATDMLMKCPSKYKDEEIYIKSEKENS
jgi:cytochrome c-type biogenesis protein CcmE